VRGTLDEGLTDLTVLKNRNVRLWVHFTSPNEFRASVYLELATPEVGASSSIVREIRIKGLRHWQRDPISTKTLARLPSLARKIAAERLLLHPAVRKDDPTENPNRDLALAAITPYKWHDKTRSRRERSDEEYADFAHAMADAMKDEPPGRDRHYALRRLRDSRLYPGDRRTLSKFLDEAIARKLLDKNYRPMAKLRRLRPNGSTPGNSSA
jgi:hypothetical protein